MGGIFNYYSVNLDSYMIIIHVYHNYILKLNKVKFIVIIFIIIGRSYICEYYNITVPDLGGVVNSNQIEIKILDL